MKVAPSGLTARSERSAAALSTGTVAGFHCTSKRLGLISSTEFRYARSASVLFPLSGTPAQTAASLDLAPGAGDPGGGRGWHGGATAGPGEANERAEEKKA